MSEQHPFDSERTEGEDLDSTTGVDRWVMPYFEDPSLWPILLVLIAHLSMFVGLVLLFSIRDGSGVAFAGLILALYVSFRSILWEIRRRRLPGAISITVVVTWVLGGLAAYYGSLYHFI